MITEDYVSFEIAKLLKEKGFDETCRAFWKEWNGELHFCACSSAHVFEFCHNSMLENYNDKEETNTAAPTLQMAMKWLRLEHKLHIEPIPDCFDYKHGDIHDGWYCEITHLSDMSYDADYDSHKKHKTCEGACEDAIKYCLENLI